MDARPRSPSPLAEALRLGGIIAIAAIAAMRCAILFVPQVVFDVDPAASPAPIGGLGPGGSLVLDVALLLACAAVFTGEARSGRGVDWRFVVLALVPAPMALWHGAADLGDLWHGATWIAALLAAVALAHAARAGATRTAAAAILLAAVAPLLARGIANVTSEHEATVREFEQNRAEIFREKGWAPDSPSALIFERRLRQREPTGWFVTSNVYGSIVAAGAVTFTALAAAAMRGRRPPPPRRRRGPMPAAPPSGALRWTALAAAIIAIALLAALLLTGSKGAIAAGAGGFLLVALRFAPARRTLLHRLGPEIAVAAIVGALAMVAVRGLLLPEGFLGERSLLFRWHYTVASARIVEAQPLPGVGPDGYQDAYVFHRVPRSPEEVASAHSIFWDWLCAVGVAGAAWIALATALVAGAGRRLGASAEEDAAGAAPCSLARPLLIVTAAAPPIALAAALLVEARSLGEIDLAVRLAGVGGAGLLAWGIARALPALRSADVDAALAGGAITLAVHAQIEMTMTQAAAAPWALALLGLAGAPLVAPRGGVRVAGAAAILTTVIAIGLAARGALPALRQEEIMVNAAATIGAGHGGATAPFPFDDADRRARAAERLVEAHAAMPTNVLPLVIAAEQLERAAQLDPAQRARRLERAAALLEQSFAQRETGRGLVTATFVERARADATGDASHRLRAVAHARRLVERDPNGLAGVRRLADLLVEAGDREGAVAAYRRALEIDADFALDPLKRLSERDRRIIEARLAELGRT
jgi:tetratricopeptide (TPR) repeat protein